MLTFIGDLVCAILFATAVMVGTVIVFALTLAIIIGGASLLM